MFNLVRGVWEGFIFTLFLAILVSVLYLFNPDRLPDQFCLFKGDVLGMTLNLCNGGERGLGE